MIENPYQILDDILDCFKDFNRPDNYFEQMELIENMRDRGIKVEAEEHYSRMGFAVTKLVKEEYLELMVHSPDPRNEDDYEKWYWRLTFEGDLLIRNGGYVEMMTRGTKDANRRDFYELVVAVGTGLAGLYVVFQIIEAVSSALAYWLIIAHLL